MSDPAVLGVLVTFDRPNDLRRSLEVLERQTYRLDLLVVVDNAPNPEVREIVEASGGAARVEYVPCADNLGPAGGIALGMERCLVGASDDDWVCLFDDDDPLAGDDVLARQVVAARQAAADVGGVGAQGAIIDWSTGRLRGVYASSSGNAASADYLKSGWCPLYRVRAIRDVGVFDRDLFFGFDDLEFGTRARAAGWRLLVTAAAGEDSTSSAASWRVGSLDWRRYYSLRNLVWLLRARGYTASALRVSVVVGIGKPVANLVLSPRLAMRHLALNARALNDAWRGRLGLTVAPGSDRRRGK